jgi:hypothetical protein
MQTAAAFDVAEKRFLEASGHTLGDLLMKLQYATRPERQRKHNYFWQARDVQDALRLIIKSLEAHGERPSGHRRARGTK